MKKPISMIVLGFLLLMAGCIPSLHPLYTEKDLVFDASLLGEWTAKGGKQTWTFTKNGGKAYTLLYRDEEGKKGVFAVHLLAVGNLRFLDFYPDKPDSPIIDVYKENMFSVHTFMRLQQEDNVLKMAGLDPIWLKKHLQENPDAIKHEKVKEGIILTAQPKDVQAFILKHDTTIGAWYDSGTITRKGVKARQ